MQYFTINSTVANVYREPDFNSSVVSQGLLGETCLVRNRRESWAECEFPDGYRGWVNTGQGIYSDKPYHPNTVCLDLFATVQQDGHSVRFLALGCQVVRNETHEIVLPDGTTGTSTGKFGQVIKGSGRETILTAARQFIGIPYVWGGRSSYGLDCSGLIQLTFFLNNIHLPRDSREQAACDQLTDIAENEALPGDLFFFGRERITHVGIYAGNQMLIHAQGYVKEESIDPDNPDGNRALYQTLQKVRSIESLL